LSGKGFAGFGRIPLFACTDSDRITHQAQKVHSCQGGPISISPGKGFDTKELSLTVPRIGSAMSTGSATPDFGGHPSGE
jgi:hypothetical protein